MIEFNQEASIEYELCLHLENLIVVGFNHDASIVYEFCVRLENLVAVGFNSEASRTFFIQLILVLKDFV